MRVTSAVEQAAGEHRDVEVRRLGAAVVGGQRAGLDGAEPEPPVGVGRAAAEAAKPGGRDGAARVVRVVEASGRVGLPGLDQPVRHRLAGAVEQPAR